MLRSLGNTMHGIGDLSPVDIRVVPEIHKDLALGMISTDISGVNIQRIDLKAGQVRYISAVSVLAKPRTGNFLAWTTLGIISSAFII